MLLIFEFGGISTILESSRTRFQSKSEIGIAVELLTRMHVKVGHAKVIMSIIQKQMIKR